MCHPPSKNVWRGLEGPQGEGMARVPPPQLTKEQEMVHIIRGKDLNETYVRALYLMRDIGVTAKSRNGEVMRSTCPVITAYHQPQYNMLLDVRRDANPFFHIFEGVWMLTGRNDVEFPSRFATNIASFSDDGRTLAGAYGHRWREHFGIDQLGWVINHIAESPDTRRAVMAMWDPEVDTIRTDIGGKDVPCNTTICFKQQNDTLDMTVFCRSNDIIWGCYGANAVHMSMLHRFVSEALDYRQGVYYHVSNDWHIYERHFPLLDAVDPPSMCYVGTPTNDLVGFGEEWQDVLHEFEDWAHNFDTVSPTSSYSSTYVSQVLIPMTMAWRAHKGGDTEKAVVLCEAIADQQIAMACRLWLQRRIK